MADISSVQKAQAKTNSLASAMQAMLLPLILAQFVASFAGSNMNVAINSIAQDLGTSVASIQATISLFTLTMAALMIPGSKLSDIKGRKRCFIVGLIIYGLGALIGAAANKIGTLMVGYSLFEGVGSALMIPPIYILTTVLLTERNARAKAFGSISAAAGVGSAAGPLVGGLITTYISWRASFIVQAILVGAIIYMARKIVDPAIEGEKPKFDVPGAILSALGLFFIVVGILQAGSYGWVNATKDFIIGDTVVIPQGGISPVWFFVGIGFLFLLWFFLHVRSYEKAGKEPLLSLRLFKNKTSNLGLITQNIQWLTLLGMSFVVSVYLQTVWGYNAVQTGLALTPAIIGLLLSSMRAERMAKKYSQRNLIRVGFVMNIVGYILLILMVSESASVFSFVPGLFLTGLGVGIMLTSSVNVVQSSFPDNDQGEISGLSRSVSNLGSSLGVAIAGSVFLASTVGDEAFRSSFTVLTLIALIGLVAAILLPEEKLEPELSGNVAAS